MSSGEPCIFDPEVVAAWKTQWEATHGERWKPTGGHDKNGQRLYRPAQAMQPLRLGPPRSATIRELELQINGRVLSPAPKETP